MKAILSKALKRNVKTITLLVPDKKGSDNIRRFKECDWVVKFYDDGIKEEGES